MNGTLRLFLLFAFCFSGGRVLLAHDFWIMPTSFTPAPGTALGLSLREGEHGEGQPVPRMGDYIARFALVGSTAEVAAVGLDGADPAGVLRLSAEGTHIAVYQSRPKPVELEAAGFERYLYQEGLASIVERRHRDGQRERPGREQYQRCAKALVRVGRAGDAGFDRNVGLPLEIIPEFNPWTSAQGISCHVRFNGKAEPSVLVVAFRPADPDRIHSARTQADGRVMLPIQAKGVWLVKCVWIVPAAANSGVDWHSYWASLTFERT